MRSSARTVALVFRWIALSLALSSGPAVPPATAVLIDLGDGSGNTSAPPDDPGWFHTAQLGGVTAVYVGAGWVLTAHHTGVGNIILNGSPVVHTPVGGTAVQLTNPDTTGADLRMYQITPVPNLPLLPIQLGTPPIGAEVVMMGKGKGRKPDPITWAGRTCYEWETFNQMRWGSSRVHSTGELVIGGLNVTESFTTQFTAPNVPANPDPRCDAGVDCPEGQGVLGDSGAPGFIKSGGIWRLAGILHTTFAFMGQPSSTSCYENETALADLDFYRDQVIEIRAGGPDLDEDAVTDGADNCPQHYNPAQEDYNGDGFGNLCDADFDENGSAGGSDIAIFAACLGLQVAPGAGPSPDDPDCGESDMDSSGAVGAPDWAIVRGCFGLPAGCTP